MLDRLFGGLAHKKCDECGDWFVGAEGERCPCRAQRKVRFAERVLKHWRVDTLERGHPAAFVQRVGMPREKWLEVRDDLERQLGSVDGRGLPNDEEAIIRLVQHDATALADPYVVARIMRARYACKMALLRTTFLGESTPNTELEEEARRAQDFLTDLGDRLRSSGVGSGATPRVSTDSFSWHLERNREFARQVVALRSKMPNASEAQLMKKAGEIAMVRYWIDSQSYQDVKQQALRVLLRLNGVKKRSGPAPVERGAMLLTCADLDLTEEQFRRMREQAEGTDGD